MTQTIERIKQLREETGAGVLACRQALEDAGGVYAEALDALREKAAAEAAKHAHRDTGQGLIEVYTHGDGRIAVMVEVNCETDFAARSQRVRRFAHETALHIAAAAPLYLCDEDIPAEVLGVERRKAETRAREAGKPEAIIPRIVEGVLNKYMERHVLLRQPYIRDDSLRMSELLSQTAAGVGENLVIRRFARWEIETPDA